MTDEDTVIGRNGCCHGRDYQHPQDIRLSDLDEPYRELLAVRLEKGASILDSDVGRYLSARASRIAELEARLARAEAALEAARHEQEVLRDQRDIWRESAREAMK